MLTYGSVCSGIEAVSVAWKGLMTPLWFSEIEPFPCAVLAHHYPDIPNLGDMTALPQKIINREIPAPDVLVGGTPCQAFSIAGLRNSLDDERGNLTLTLIHILEAIDYVRYIDGKQPCILLWENVPGVLSTKDNAFGHLLAGLAQEREPLQPTGSKWSNAGYVHSARTIAWRVLDAQYFGLAQRRKRVFVTASARHESSFQILFERKSNYISSYKRTEEITPTLTAKSGRRYNDSEIIITTERGSRWLTPDECERLMGFPTGYTQIPYRNKPADDCPDNPRYKAIGNSMAVPVIKWIGERIINYIEGDK